MKTLSGSTQDVRPKWYDAAPSHVHAVERWLRWSGSSREQLHEGDDGARRTRPRWTRSRSSRPSRRGDARAAERDHERRRRAARAGRSRPRRSRSASQRSAAGRRRAGGAAATSRRSGRGRRRPRTRRPPSRRSRTPGPAPSPLWRENAISARLPPLSMISSESRTISGERRSSTPSAPIEKRIALIARYQVTSGPHRASAEKSSRCEWWPRTTPPTAAASRTIDVTSNASR